jgi:hypothetical protein
VVTGETDANGNVNLLIGNAPANARLFYTVVGQDLMPEVDKSLD